MSDRPKPSLHFIISYMFIVAYPKLTVSVEIQNNIKHLRLIASEYPVSLMAKRGDDQSVLSAEGVSFEILLWLSKFDHFSYSFLPVYRPTVENSSDILGLIYYVHVNAADAIIGSLIMSPFRNQYVDFPQPWMQEPAVLVIPVPNNVFNIGSIWQPFQWPVWIAIWLSIFLIIFCLYLVLNPRTYRYYATNRISKLGIYAFGLILSQGGHLRSNRLVSRFIAGTWCLVTFVLVQAYSSTLISFVTTPISTPLVKSPEELANQPHINLVVQKYYGTEVLLSTAQDPLSKKLSDKLRTYSKSRCMKIQECLDLVASGNHVFIHGYGSALEGMNDDYTITKKCRFSFAKNILSSRSYAWAVAKNSDLMEPFNRGVLKMKEYGLVTKWIDNYQSKPRRCLDQLERGYRTSKNNRRIQLTLKSLLGAFVVLFIGYGFSVISFIYENIRR